MLITISWALSCGQNHHITANSSFILPSIKITTSQINLGNTTITGTCAGNDVINLNIQNTQFTNLGSCKCNGSSFSCSINVTKIPCSDDPLEITADMPTVNDIAQLEIDFDADGVINSVDLDDDNDGILDSRYNYGDLDSYVETLAGQGVLPNSYPFTRITGTADYHRGDPTPMHGVNSTPYSGNNYIAFHTLGIGVSIGQRLETWSIALAAPFSIGEKIKIDMHVLVLDPGLRAWNNPSDIFFYGGTSNGDESLLLGSVSTGASNADGWVARSIEATLTEAITHITIYNVSHGANESYVGIDGIGITKLYDSGGHCDIDTDNDGITDLLESEFAAGIAADINNNGMVDLNESVDSDNDGLMDIFEGGDLSVNSGTTPLDSDTDVILNIFDLDSDGDILTDLSESGHVAGIAADLNGNGEIDNTEGIDSNGDGLMDVFD